ncbi:alpha/beta hydrolase [Streptomyces sp. NPDC093085]|uniref:alpha/beta hydrolase n=1 Tax=Streptomyces sp. NPDC093085 TaxID=3155068 RepID=UPI0034444B8E
MATTAFVLVSGAHTGGWVWREVAAPLRAAGSEAYEVTLTGMGDRRAEASPDTDLETHIRDVVEVVDRVAALDPVREVVLVGHCYGIHPVLGAADRRTERVARVVYLDAGLAQDGDAPLALAPDQAVRDRVAAAAGAAAGAAEPGPGPAAGAVAAAVAEWLVPPPPVDEPERWGGTAGVPEAALRRLARLAAPQPLATLTRPLRLRHRDALAALPTTGVFCTADGSGIALVEMAVATGQPRFQALAHPRVGFFELATGHWPMLSVPDELARVLLAAAADEGRRVAPVPAHQPPPHLGRFPLEVPEDAGRGAEGKGAGGAGGAEGAERGGVDLTERTTAYFPAPAPASAPAPAVVFVHGGPVPADARPTPREWPVFVGYARYAASLGAVGVTVDHRLHGLTDYRRAAEDIAEAVARVRSDPRVDGERIALWFFSGGGLLLADWLAAPPPWLRCAAATYPVLAPLPGWSLVEPRFRPVAALGGAGRLPVVLTRVGRERPEIAATVEEFLGAAAAHGANVEVIDAPRARHGFDALAPEEPEAETAGAREAAEAAEAIEQAVRTVLTHLRRTGEPTAEPPREPTGEPIGKPTDRTPAPASD